jgi:transposase-like protein
MSNESESTVFVPLHTAEDWWMRKNRFAKYPLELKMQIVREVLTKPHMSVTIASYMYNINQSSIRRWVEQYEHLIVSESGGGE